MRLLANPRLAAQTDVLGPLDERQVLYLRPWRTAGEAEVVPLQRLDYRQ
jgi:hypothetical protein